MASLVSTVSSSLLTTSLAFKPSPNACFSSKPILGLPALKKLHISCSSAKSEQDTKQFTAQLSASGIVAASLAVAQPALALVDERLSTEGTGLSLGVSNPLLIWILLGVFTLIWSLFFVYSSSLPEGDDDSGLAL